MLNYHIFTTVCVQDDYRTPYVHTYEMIETIVRKLQTHKVTMMRQVLHDVTMTWDRPCSLAPSHRHTTVNMLALINTCKLPYWIMAPLLSDCNAVLHTRVHSPNLTSMCLAAACTKLDVNDARYANGSRHAALL